jgi:hypothetical protein
MIGRSRGKDDFALKNKLYGFHYKEQNGLSLCEFIVKCESFHNKNTITYQFFLIRIRKKTNLARCFNILIIVDSLFGFFHHLNLFFLHLMFFFFSIT